MIFKQWKLVLEELKWQTRRILRGPVDIEREAIPGAMPSACPIKAVYMNGRLIEAVGRTRAVQPGRTKKGIARIEITALRIERVQDISEDDVIAEGVGLRSWDPGGWYGWPRTAGYAELWDSINTRPGDRWDDNPLVLVRDFRLVRQ